MQVFQEIDATDQPLMCKNPFRKAMLVPRKWQEGKGITSNIEKKHFKWPKVASNSLSLLVHKLRNSLIAGGACDVGVSPFSRHFLFRRCSTIFGHVCKNRCAHVAV
jgi:hypothetical protein